MGIPADVNLLPYTTKRELLAHSLSTMSTAEKEAAKLVKVKRPSDKFAMGRRDDMGIYFSTIQGYVSGREDNRARDLFSTSCCAFLRSAEGFLCHQLTGHGILFKPMFPDSANGEEPFFGW